MAKTTNKQYGATKGQKALAGAATGAAVGTAAYPGIGTAVGAVGGAAIGYLSGDDVSTSTSETGDTRLYETPYAEREYARIAGEVMFQKMMEEQYPGLGKQLSGLGQRGGFNWPSGAGGGDGGGGAPASSGDAWQRALAQAAYYGKTGDGPGPQSGQPGMPGYDRDQPGPDLTVAGMARQMTGRQPGDTPQTAGAYAALHGENGGLAAYLSDKPGAVADPGSHTRLFGDSAINHNRLLNYLRSIGELQENETLAQWMDDQGAKWKPGLGPRNA